MLPPLDVPTLFVVSAAVIAWSGCVLIAARGRHEGAVPLAFWGSAMLLGSTGIVLLSLAPFTDWPARAAGNVAILIGVALSWSGARVFAARRFQPMMTLAGAAAWLLVYALPWEVARPVPGVFAFLLGAMYILATAAELWRGRAERLPTRAAAIILLVVHGAVYLIQAGGNVVAPAIFRSSTLFVFLMMEALLHTTGMAFLFLALMKERAELRSTLQLRKLATLDGLTGLGNRRHFDQLLENEFRRAARVRSSIGLLMIDVDQFKTFNDTYGHQAGDDCLRRVATAMNRAVHRAGDVVVRYGGEEFAVLLPRTDEAGAIAVADDIRTEIQTQGIAHHASNHGVVTVSIGIACQVPDTAADQPGMLLRAADQALYQAKASGRNISRVADTSSRHVAGSA